MNNSKRFVPGGIYQVWTSMGMRTWNVVSVGDDGWIEVADQSERCFLNTAQIIQYIQMD